MKYWNITKNIALGFIGVGIISIILTFLHEISPQEDGFILPYMSISWAVFILAKTHYDYYRDKKLEEK